MYKLTDLHSKALDERIFSPSLLLLLAACGGGGGSSGARYSGTVYNGPIEGAQI